MEDRKWEKMCPNCNNKDYHRILGKYADYGYCPKCKHVWWKGRGNDKREMD